MEERELILTVGLPRAGKSTWAKKQGWPIVNPDSIRLALHGQRYAPEAESFVWAIVYVMVDALFMAGNSKVILDATSNTRRRRDFWIKKYAFENTKVSLKIFKTSKEECIKRANEGNTPHLVSVIERMARESDWRDL